MKTIADVYAEHNAADTHNSQAPTADKGCTCGNCVLFVGGADPKSPAKTQEQYQAEREAAAQAAAAKITADAKAAADAKAVADAAAAAAAAANTPTV